MSNFAWNTSMYIVNHIHVILILHVFSIKTIPLLRPLIGLSPQGGRYRGILLYGISVYLMTFDLGWHCKVKSRSFGVHWVVYFICVL